MCLASTSIILLLIAPSIRDDKVYVAASLDKEYQLSTKPSPRIIFVGGSNLALGLDSKQVESALGLHVVNMGLHAGLGLSFPLNEAQSGIRQGDLVILSIEHFLSGDGKKLIAQLIDINPKAYKYFDLSPFDMIGVYFQSVQRCVSGLFYRMLNIIHVDHVYNRQGFTINGDLKSHFGELKPAQLRENVTFVAKDYSSSIKEINLFIKVARQKGANVYFTYPVFPKSAYKRNKIALTDLSIQYNTLLNCPILGTLETFVLPDQDFFDTLYHLDSIGVHKRTDIMINVLKHSKISH